MKEIDLSPYAIAGHKDKFEPRIFLGETLLSPLLKLGGLELLASFKLADRIQVCETDKLLVDDKEYAKIKRVTELPSMAGAAIGFGRNEVEMIRRILEAPDVQIEKKNA